MQQPIWASIQVETVPLLSCVHHILVEIKRCSPAPKPTPEPQPNRSTCQLMCTRQCSPNSRRTIACELPPLSVNGPNVLSHDEPCPLGNTYHVRRHVHSPCVTTKLGLYVSGAFAHQKRARGSSSCVCVSFDISILIILYSNRGLNLITSIN